MLKGKELVQGGVEDGGKVEGLRLGEAEGGYWGGGKAFSTAQAGRLRSRR